MMKRTTRLGVFSALTLTWLVAEATGCSAEPATPDHAEDSTAHQISDLAFGEDPESSVAVDDQVDAPVLAACAPNISKFRELEIVDPSVVGNPRAKNVASTNKDGTTNPGHWSFRFLVEQMAPTGVDPGDFVLAMLKSWETDHTVNGFTVANRKAGIDQVIASWAKLPNGKLDLAKSPLRLEAIVYRPDLSSGCNAGEGRFVFGLTNGPADDARSFAELMTVIFEYHLPTTTTVTPHTWATRFHRLNQPVGDAGIPIIDSVTYRGLLQGITDLFAKRGASPTAPNGNAISQVRSNEIQLGNPWQLREFHLVNNSKGQGFLVPSATAQNADPTLNDTGTLHDFILDNKATINAGTAIFPKTISGGISNETTGAPSFAWMTSDPSTKAHPEAIDATTKRNFSMLTCNGCHHESQVTKSGFYHVSPIDPPGPDGTGKLSTFLLGDGTKANPGDLARRAQAETSLLCTTACVTPPVAIPARVH